jgi:hypothetical protein
MSFVADVFSMFVRSLARRAQTHFDRKPLVGDFARDQDTVLLDAPRLIQVFRSFLLVRSRRVWIRVMS